MKIYLDDELVLEVTEIKKKILCDSLFSEDLREDLKRRLKYIIERKCEKCLERLKHREIPKLKDTKLKSIPLDDEELAELIFKQEDYKGRSERDKRTSENIRPKDVV